MSVPVLVKRGIKLRIEIFFNCWNFIRWLKALPPHKYD